MSDQPASSRTVPARLPLSLMAYRLVGRLASPLVGQVLRRRLARGKEDGARLSERFGTAGRPRPEGPLVWLHAASVGETMSILPLIEAIASSGRTALLTTGTVTSAELAADRLPQGALHQFVPIDLPGPVQRFMAHWRPDLAVFCESEIWPNLMIEAARMGIPLGIVNGRMSERSFRSWSRLPGAARSLLGSLAFCLAQTEGDAARYAALGACAKATGNLKFDVPALPVDPAAREALLAAIGPREVLVAASTHPGEEEQIFVAVAEIRNTHPDLLTIIVPRHPSRGETIAADAAAGGLLLRRRARGQLPDEASLVYLADTLGELGLFYSVATLAFIGGTLAPIGGHNPIEAARLGAPILHGPATDKNREIFSAFDGAGAAVEVADASALAREASRLLADRPARDDLSARAHGIVASAEGALSQTLAAIDAILEPAL